MNKNCVEVCANCGRIADSSDYPGKEFLCSRCKCRVSVVLPREMANELIKEGFGKKD